MRDGNHDSKSPKKLKIRISSRKGKSERFSSLDTGFRCAQTIKKHERSYHFKANEISRVIKFRAPIHHSKIKNFKKFEKTEL